jgi:hypothetical protein
MEEKGLKGGMYEVRRGKDKIRKKNEGKKQRRKEMRKGETVSKGNKWAWRKLNS